LKHVLLIREFFGTITLSVGHSEQESYGLNCYFQNIIYDFRKNFFSFMS